MNTLALPDGARPSNLVLPPGTSGNFIESDVLGICERVKEIDPALSVVLLQSGDGHAFAIMERCVDGVERLIFRVKQLDGRVLQKLRGIMAEPLDVRFKRLEAEEYRLEEQRKDNELEELYEQMGRPMWTQLEHDGFIQRPVSYPKRGVTKGRGSKGSLISYARGG